MTIRVKGLVLVFVGSVIAIFLWKGCAIALSSTYASRSNNLSDNGNFTMSDQSEAEFTQRYIEDINRPWAERRGLESQ